MNVIIPVSHAVQQSVSLSYGRWKVHSDDLSYLHIITYSLENRCIHFECEYFSLSKLYVILVCFYAQAPSKIIFNVCMWLY